MAKKKCDCCCLCEKNTIQQRICKELANIREERKLKIILQFIIGIKN